MTVIIIGMVFLFFYLCLVAFVSVVGFLFYVNVRSKKRDSRHKQPHIMAEVRHRV